MRKLFIIIAITCLIAPLCAGEENKNDSGMFSEGSFLSEAVSSVSDKINKVATGEEAIINDNAKGMDSDTQEYYGDSTGRPKGLSKRYEPKKQASSNAQQ